MKHTYPSIEKNIIGAANQLGETRIFCHFFNQTNIHNPRTGESGPLDQNEYKLLNADWVVLDEPGSFLSDSPIDQIKLYGDEWEDNFFSLTNLFHQLHSLKQVAAVAIAWNPDVVIFVRPDLEYLDSFERPLKKAMSCDNSIFIPSWQHWLGGFNDRFSICVSKPAAQAYGNRINQALNYCKIYQEPLHAEKLTAFALKNQDINIKFTHLRANRVRSDGSTIKEDFTDFRISRLIRKVHVKYDKLMGAIYKEN